MIFYQGRTELNKVKVHPCAEMVRFHCWDLCPVLWPGLCVPLEDWALIDSICMFPVFGRDIMTSWAGTRRVTLTVATRVHSYSMLLSCSFSFKSNICILYSKAMNTSYYVQVMNLWRLCHINIRSMKANLTSFEICLQNLEFQFSVIGITETWLSDSNSDLYTIDGYNFIETHRTERSGGGVGIFLRSNILYQRRPDITLNNGLSEYIFIEIDKDLFNKNRNIIIGVIYRPPNTDLELFNDDINELLDNLEREHKYCYLIGDYNIYLLNYSK